jgi:DNA-binding NtrC family response regulator
MVKFRLITATNKNLMQMVTEGKFRLDLYHRISTFTINTPPLRNHTDDISELSNFFLTQIQKEVGEKKLLNSAIDALAAHKWPGNCRELKNVLYRSAAFCSGVKMGARHIKINRFTELHNQKQTDQQPYKKTNITPELINKTLYEAGYKINKAARMLNIPRSTLRYKIRQLNIKIKKSAPPLNDHIAPPKGLIPQTKS